MFFNYLHKQHVLLNKVDLTTFKGKVCYWALNTFYKEKFLLKERVSFLEKTVTSMRRDIVAKDKLVTNLYKQIHGEKSVKDSDNPSLELIEPIGTGFLAISDLDYLKEVR